MEKPISYKIQMFQKEVSNIIQQSELPIIILKYVIKDLYTELEGLANEFAQKEINEYTQSLQEDSDSKSSSEK